MVPFGYYRFLNSPIHTDIRVVPGDLVQEEEPGSWDVSSFVVPPVVAGMEDDQVGAVEILLQPIAGYQESSLLGSNRGREQGAEGEEQTDARHVDHPGSWGRRLREPRDLTSNISPHTTESNLATLWQRIFSRCIDMTLLIIIVSVLFGSFKSLFPDWAYILSRFPEQAIIYIAFFIYLVLFEMIPTIYFGQSPGKKCIGIKVVSGDHIHNGVFVAFFRLLLKYTISTGTLFLGGLWILFNKKRKSWHDFIVKTTVEKVTKKNRPNMQWRSFFKTIFGRIVSISLLIIILFFIFAAIGGWGRQKTHWIAIAEALKSQGQFSESLDEYNQLIQKYPEFGKSYQMRGALYIEAYGDIENAISDYDTAISLNSRDQSALQGIIQLYLTKTKMLNHKVPNTSQYSQSKSGQSVEFIYPDKPQSYNSPKDKSSNNFQNKEHSYLIKTPKNKRSAYVKPLKIGNILPLHLEGQSPAQTIQKIRTKTKDHILKSLKVDPNNDQLRELAKAIDPTVKLPPKQPCFIVTAACEDRNAYEVKTMCDFRDQILCKTALGRKVISIYYAYGYSLTSPIRRFTLLRVFTRIGLQPIVLSAWLLLNLKIVFLIKFFYLSLTIPD